MTGKTIMVMGTSSSAGKSLLTAALCRCLARRGFRVAPFKSQNMSNNAAVCSDGSEIGRSQALQAIASGTPPHSDMNPILLKPEGDCRSQVIVNGRPHETLEATDYFQRRQQLWPHVTSALDRLRSNYEIVVIEGAGSPAELNLAHVEMVNMSVARYCQAPVLLIGDIERGGVFAQLLGTLWLLPPEERCLIAGLIVNKFRGDLSLFDSGVEILRDRGGVPVLGVLPWIDSLRLPEEDAVALDALSGPPAGGSKDKIDVAVIRLPHIANFDDFDPLMSHDLVSLRYARSTEELGTPDVTILPGTKNTLGDLQWLRDSGLAQHIVELANSGGRIVGICGGYQMMGKQIHNPHQLENGIEHANGLGLLPIETTFFENKQTCQVEYCVTDDFLAPGTKGLTLSGYEIHCGRTTTDAPWLSRDNTLGKIHDGSRSDDGLAWGCYLHGLFESDVFLTAWLESIAGPIVSNPSQVIRSASRNHESKAGDAHLAPDQSSPSQTVHTDSKTRLENSLDRLADTFEQYIDVNQLVHTIFNFQSEAEPRNVG